MRARAGGVSSVQLVRQGPNGPPTAREPPVRCRRPNRRTGALLGARLEVPQASGKADARPLQPPNGTTLPACAKHCQKSGESRTGG